MEMIFLSEVFWLVTRAGKMGPSCPIGISRFDLAQTYKIRNSWTISGMKSQIVAEKSQTFFPGSWNKPIIFAL